MLRAFLGAIFRSALGIVGALLTTVSALLFVMLFVLAELNPRLGGGYAGIITFLVLPVFFVLGLVLMPIGLARVRRAERAGGEARAPVIDLNVPRTRSVVTMVTLLSVVNLGIIATATYKGVQTMDSVEFCGGACHSVMSPEATAHQLAPHAKVQCTKCHVGSGAEWFVRGKTNGIDQLFSVAFGTYPRPIPTPIDGLRSPSDTCEECHSRERGTKEQLRVINRFQEDEANTWKKTVLLDKVSVSHWHVRNTVRFRSNAKRTFVGEVELALPDGGVRRWKNAAGPPEDGGALTDAWRTMDCLDCHNRPAHTYQRPRDEVDRALASGELDRELPFIRREGLRIIQGRWPSHDAAREGIAAELRAFYSKQAPAIEAGRIDAAAKALFALYSRNVFPAMNVQWGTYPSFRDHEGDNGCFRCHVSDLESPDEHKISDRCELCHLVVAEEEDAPEVLEFLTED